MRPSHDRRPRQRCSLLPRRRRVLAAALVAFPLASCRAPRPLDVATEPFPEVRKEIERALADLLVAVERKDFARLESMHLYGPKFSRWDGRNPGRLDAEGTRRVERAGLEPLDSMRATVEDLKVDVFGPAAVATFVMPYEATAAGQSTRGKTRATLVWVKAGADWKIAHEHLSPVPAASP